ncbi:hypothetical protein ABXW19_12005, partial [Streptococcus suis]|uniref:hypothetical protein n=1 Tax=Streptococcus suis TaxID=1307 RepID=UPI003CF2B848
ASLLNGVVLSRKILLQRGIASADTCSSFALVKKVNPGVMRAQRWRSSGQIADPQRKRRL